SSRRHTRFSRDWSSDVCSSDLCHVLTGFTQNMHHIERGTTANAHQQGFHRARTAILAAMIGRTVHKDGVTGTGFRLKTGFALPFNHSFHHLLLLGTGAARRARPQMGAQSTTERPRDHTLRARSWSPRRPVYHLRPPPTADRRHPFELSRAPTLGSDVKNRQYP